MFRHMHITCDHVKVRGHLVVISYHFLPCGSQESEFVLQPWWQAPSPTEPPHRPHAHIALPICFHLESAQRTHTWNLHSVLTGLELSTRYFTGNTVTKLHRIILTRRYQKTEMGLFLVFFFFA